MAATGRAELLLPAMLLLFEMEIMDTLESVEDLECRGVRVRSWLEAAGGSAMTMAAVHCKVL